MTLIAVGLDDQTLVAPDEVDFVGADGLVDLGLGEAVLAAHATEATLKVASGWRGFCLGSERFLDVVLAEFGLTDCSTEVVLVDHTPEVDDRAGGARDRDFVTGASVGEHQGGGAVEMDAALFRSPGVGGDGHVNRSLAVIQHFQQLGGAPVREHGPVAAGEHCCHPLSLDAQFLVTNRVNPTVDAVQAPRSNPSVNPGGSQAQADQMRELDYSVLPCRDLGYEDVWLGDFFPHTEKKSPTPLRAPLRRACPAKASA